MAATIIDEVLDPVEDNPEEFTQEELTEKPVEEVEPDNDLPEKYRGKSLAEIVEMHREAEKLLGRQSSEVGELRRVVDDFIKGSAAKEAPQDEVDFFEDPKEAINRAIESHPKVKEAEEMSQKYRASDTLSRLKMKYPDLESTVQDPNFSDWVQASKIRTQLYLMADQQGDFDAADELLGTWEEKKSVAKKSLELEETSRKQSVKAASTGNVRGSGESSRKMYRRADIINLMKTDPERYAAMADDIMAAYREGRVK